MADPESSPGKKGGDQGEELPQIKGGGEGEGDKQQQQQEQRGGGRGAKARKPADSQAQEPGRRRLRAAAPRA